MIRRTSVLKTLTLLAAAIASQGVFAQGEGNNWYFGANAGVTFNSGSPVALTNGMVNTIEGSAVQSDKNGNLLFYSDGSRVWNKTHVQMPNGFGMNGNSSSTQSCIIVPQPLSNTIFYVFTVGVSGSAFGLQYSVVDMTQNGGLGNVTTKNVPLVTPTEEKVTACRHANGCDFWVVTQRRSTNSFYAYKVTSAGVNATPVISSSGSISTNDLGYLKINPQGTKMASAVWGQSRFEFFDFNNATGVVSNGFATPANYQYAYGVEFSANGNVVYGTGELLLKVYQWNLLAGTQANILASVLQVGTSASSETGALQLGPDNKIYLARYPMTWLGVINNPNTVGLGCNYVDNGVPLAGKTCYIGLPDFISTIFIPKKTIASVTVCLGATFSLSDTTGILTLGWNFGDPNSGSNNTSSLLFPSHNFTSAGTYTVQTIINYACRTDTVKTNVTVVSCGITVTAPGGTVCPGGCKNITATVSAGTSPYTYSWNTGATTQSINPCPTATTSYTVVATDANGATASAVATITVSSAIVINTTVQNVKCNGGTTGSATSTVSGGTSPYTYSWSNAQTGSTASGLGQGSYTLTVTDANGCTGTATIVITQPAVLTAVASGQNVSCAGGNNGSATVTAGGGTTNYTYSWSNAQTGATASNLIAGTYTITVTDANGCTATATVAITQPSAVTVQTSTTNATCAQAGTISTTVNGGTGSYTYTWNNGQNGATATGLSAGTYTLAVSDANGCTATATATITGISGPTAAGMSSINNVLCNGGNTGSATATATGGTGSYTYSWNNSQATATATGLAAGTYTVTITDANNCSITATVTVTEPTALVATATGVNACSNATANGSAAGGTTNYTYLWSNGQTTQNATGLATGVYTLTVTDANGCSASDTAVINVSVPPVVTFAANDSAGCVALCVNFTCTTANIASYTWSFGDGTGTGNPANHCYKSAGTYTVILTVTDNNGCTGSLTKSSYINVFPNVVASFVAGPQPTTILNPVITFTDLSSGGANSWSWTFGDVQNSTSNLQNPFFTYKDSGCYNVQLIADNQYNCPDTTEQVVCVQGDYELFAPNAFTPDGNLLNDTWNVQGIGIDPDHFELYIYDRWGNLIYKTSDLYKGWDGKANGGKEIAQQDVYVWKVFTRDFLGGKHSYIGHMSLLR